MLKISVLTAAMAAACVIAGPALAAGNPELDDIRAQIRDMKQSYEARLQALEQRLQDAQAATAQAQNAALAAHTSATAKSAATPAAPPASGADSTTNAPPALATNAAPAPAADLAAGPSVTPPATASNAFNPNISLVLGGTLSNLSQDPARYKLQGFMPPAGEIGPGKRSFNLGESELTLAANIDPQFAGQLTFSLGADNTASVEEAFVQTRALGNGVNLRAGRFLSSIGYLNNKHAHTWDFVDAPLAYQAFLGGQYKPDGVQATWLAPTDMLVEVGTELANGSSFPGSDRNKNGVGAATFFAHAGDDIGTSGSWRAGLSYLRTRANERAFDDPDLGTAGAFSGNSRLWIADAIYKWAPNGNPTQQNFKVQGEYFRRTESGLLAVANDSGNYASTQSGWYLQGIYQFMPNWRAGVRYDRLDAGSSTIGVPGAQQLLPILSSYNPSRSSLMFDYSPSEFARLRLQFARDQSRPGAADNQIFLQYIMSLGTHAAHAF